ncbi:Uma2 family endonuclease [Nocardiopsis potens]|uniref:Uma2 family endonuclease n=1 Tax=Nocardiopsis potens TaxID=1246458 RepID=UPI0003465943|nr:Uma2 family endonuclease [Nocardiopsis potens]
MAEPEPVSDRDDAQFELLLRTWRELDVPDGWRAEIIGGDIRLMAPPSDPHNLIANRIHKRLAGHVPDEWGVYQTLGVHIGKIDDLYVPDVVVMPDEIVSDPEKTPNPAEEARLVVEIVSKGNAENDRKKKLWGYAHGKVPLYLLVDRWSAGGPSVTLYEQPEDGFYRRHSTVPFGEKVYLPEPIGAEIDTERFPGPDWGLA